ncbi:MAG: ABC transporter ATP-binding protein, partial [Candidatus Methanomethylophilaceae archaeon]|nr:ABC transporter ATP-binding protein [Candidatus Methanomethylophilaceae archaeon]
DLFRRMFDILSADGVRIVMITHELEDIPSCVDRVIMIKEGRKIADGSKKDVLTDAKLSELYDSDIEVTVDEHAYHMRIRGDA